MTNIAARPESPRLPGPAGPDTLRLEIPALNKYLPLATGFAEHSARAFGLNSEEAVALSLAVEEIVAALTSMSLEVKLQARNGQYYTELELTIPYTELSLEKMNLTAAISDDADLDQMGWMLAARMVDGFAIEHVGQRSTIFRLRKSRSYACESRLEPLPAGDKAVEIRLAEPAELVAFGHAFLQRGQPALDDHLLQPPARLADMIASGDYEAMLAFTEAGQSVAGVLVDRVRPSLAVIHGPYLLEQPPEVGQQLVQAVFEHLTRRRVEGVVAHCDQTTALPEMSMQRLGQRRLRLPDSEEGLDITTYFRHLSDDQGFLAWGTPWLNDFLRTEYRRLDLPRDIQNWRAPAGGLPKLPSLLSCDFRKQRAECLIRPVLTGCDMEENLAAHLRLLDNEGYLNVLFELDLGQAAHLAFSEALHDNGFRPVYLLPSAGKGDLLVLEHAT